MQMIQAPSLGDIIVGGLLVVFAIAMRSHFIKHQPENKKMRSLCIVLMIIGWVLILINPMFSLAKLN
jgi:hypothetical protein